MAILIAGLSPKVYATLSCTQNCMWKERGEYKDWRHVQQKAKRVDRGDKGQVKFENECRR